MTPKKLTSIIYLCLILFKLPVYGNTQTTPLLFHELTEEQKNLLENDLPLREIALPEGQYLWLIGQNQLWRYDMEIKELEEVHFHYKKLFPYRIHGILLWKDSLFLADDETLFQLEGSKELSIYSYEGLSEKGVLTHSLRRDSLGYLQWVKTDGIQVIDPKEKRTVDLRPASLPLGDFSYNLTEDSFIYAEGNKIFKRFRNGKESHFLFESEEDLKFLGEQNSLLYWQDKNNIHLFNLQGEVKQIIPIQSKSRLYQTVITQYFDAYLFWDNTLEIHDKTHKTTEHFLFPLKGNGKILSFQMNRDYGAALFQKKLLLFNKEKSL